ncbi:MAG: hypothetical protein WEB37_13730 [Bacteroidota bacterium]
MKFSPRHSTVTNLVVLLGFLLASSGFTTILHECRLEQQMSCCAPPPEAHDEICGVEIGSNVAVVIESDVLCHTTIVVGGVTTGPALLEKTGKTESKRTGELPLTSVHVSFPPHNTNRISSLFSPSELVFPSSVEKYVLNASFLI